VFGPGLQGIGAMECSKATGLPGNSTVESTPIGREQIQPSDFRTRHKNELEDQRRRSFSLFRKVGQTFELGD
jgi:hypothetical protein